MRFTLTDEIDFPRDLVYPTLRDRTLDFLPYLVNVAEIQVIEEHTEGGVKRSIKRWRGSSDEIPAALRPLVRPDFLVWIDHATWDAHQFTCEWRHEFKALPNGVSARGLTRYEAQGDVTVVHMDGEFNIHPEGLTFVPNVLARKLSPGMERFVIERLKPNMRAANEAVASFLEDQAG